MTPEYIDSLAERADPDQLWRRNPLDALDMPPEQHKQHDTAVALRRYAHLLRAVDAAAANGESWLITKLGPNSTAVRRVKTPADHRKMIEARAKCTAGVTVALPDDGLACDGNSKSLVEAIAAHIDGWRSATFGWQDDPDPSQAARNRGAAIEAHAAECLRRIRVTLGVEGRKP